MPLSDFTDNLVGGKFDFKHLKDWTIVNIQPAGSEVYISNLVLVGCPTSSVAASTSAESAAAQTTSSTEPSSQVNSAESILSSGVSFLAMIAALF